MWTGHVGQVLVAGAALMACVALGGGLYESLVVDPSWPRRPGIIQPGLGGISRRRFWIPVSAGFGVLLAVSLVVTWGHCNARAALLVALASHVVMRVWWLVDLAAKASAFEKADPARIDQAAALRWTRRRLAMLPLDLITCAAMLAALATV